MSLLIRPQVRIGDGPRGYLAAFAEANCLSVGDLSRIGITFNVDTLRRERCSPPKGQQPLLDDYVERVSALLCNLPRGWVRQRARFCPTCLQDWPRWHVGWELQFVDACPIHGVWLVDVCGRCNKAITWRRAKLLCCDCGQPFFTLKAVECPNAVSRLSGVLIDALMRSNTEHKFGPTGGLDVEQLQRLIRFLGCYADSGLGPWPQKVLGLESVATSWRLTSLAAEMLQDWPKSLYTVLDRMQRERADTGGGRLPGRFGYFYTVLYRGFPEEVFAPLREAFENYVAEHWRGALSQRNRRFPPGILQRAAWIPANHACDQLGLSRRRLVELIAEKKIAGETRTGPTGREFIVVLRHDVEQQMKALAQEVSLIEVAVMLGLTKRRMQVLLPQLLPEARRTGSAGMPWAIPRQRAGRLLEIIEGTQKVHEVPDGYVSLGHVLRFWAWSDKAVANLLSEVISSVVIPAFAIDDGSGVPALVLGTQELRDWHARTHQALRSNLSIPDVAERIGVKQEVAYALVRNGLLPIVGMDAGTKRDGQGVTPSALETFGQRYVFARDLAKQLGRSPKAIVEKLGLLGVQPVCGPKIDGCRQILYLNDCALTKAVEVISVVRHR